MGLKEKASVAISDSHILKSLNYVTEQTSASTFLHCSENSLNYMKMTRKQVEQRTGGAKQRSFFYRAHLAPALARVVQERCSG